MALPKRDAGSKSLENAASRWQAYYDLEDPSAVEAFVARYPGLDRLLSQMAQQFAARLQLDARPAMRVSQEPDSDETDEWLTIEVWSGSDWDDTRARLDRFDDEWWLDAMPRGEPLIAILQRSR